MPLHEKEVKGRFHVVGFDHHGGSFLLYHTDVKQVAINEFEKHLGMVEPRYPGIELIEIHRHAD
jgi:hypothetical protein